MVADASDWRGPKGPWAKGDESCLCLGRVFSDFIGLDEGERDTRAVGVNCEHRGIASAVTGDRVWSALIAFHRPGARGDAEVRRAARSPIVLDLSVRR